MNPLVTPQEVFSALFPKVRQEVEDVLAQHPEWCRAACYVTYREGDLVVVHDPLYALLKEAGK